mmetsp:Transcript_5200/g.10767  ORF Transcript_5200/g.10767 Transcript_5200/m.10767 type:complete len:135 (-) Transcript_5200:195-599(-)
MTVLLTRTLVFLEYSNINSRASSDTEEEDENEEEDAVVAEVEDVVTEVENDEAEEDESNNHEETELLIAIPDVDSEVARILQETGLEKYQTIFAEYKFLTLKDCKSIDYSVLRGIGGRYLYRTSESIRVLRDSQ